MSTIDEDFDDLLKRHNLSEQELKAFFHRAVGEHWPSLPSFSTLDAPKIEEVETATFGCGVAPVFFENGVPYIVLAQAGAHYEHEYKKNPNNTAPFPECYLMPGGFANLTLTEGSSKVPASDKPEKGRIAAARETEEELPLEDGEPLWSVDPDRFIPMDTDTLAFRNGSKRIVMGFKLELEQQEVSAAKAYVSRLKVDPEFKTQVLFHTRNKDSKLPEIENVKIFRLEDAANGTVPLLHKDQQSLFRIILEDYKRRGLVNEPAPSPI